jgi:hypothetical protein
VARELEEEEAAEAAAGVVAPAWQEAATRGFHPPQVPQCTGPHSLKSLVWCTAWHRTGG